LSEIRRRHGHRRGHARRLLLTQQRLHRPRAHRRRPGQQLRQGRRHGRLAFARRQVQHLHVVLVRAGAILRLQGVVGLAERGRRVQVSPEGVAGERPRLAHQPADDMAVVDGVLALPAQPRHPLHQGVGVPHLDLLHAQAHLDDLADQPRRHGVGVAPHLDGAAPAHAHPQALLRLQPPRRQPPQRGQLRRYRRLPRLVPPPDQLAQEPLVGGAIGEVPAAAQQQRLRHGLLEAPVALLAIAVLVSAGRVGRLAAHPVVRQQRRVPRREPLGLAVGVDRQRHPVRAVTRRHPVQRPEGVLQPRAEAREALGEAHHDVFPVRVGQHEVVHEVVERLAGDRHPQAAHVREVRGAQPPRLMHLREVHLLGRPVLRLPRPHAPLQRPPHRVGVAPRVGALQPAQQRHRLQLRLPGEHRLQLGPDVRQRVRARPPRPRPPRRAG
jgi:hypothetical protein